MITARVCFAALAVVRDAETNAISAFNILEGITAAGFPLLLQNVAFFVLWEREATDPDHVQGRLIVNIDQEQLGAAPINADFAGSMRNRSIANVNGLVVTRSGQLRFRIELDTGAHAEYTVAIVAPPPVINAQIQ